MKTIKIKLITGIILLLLFSTLFGVFLYRTNVRNDAKQDYQRRAIEIRALTTSIEEGAGLSRAVDGFVVNDSREKAMLAAAACQEIMTEGWDGKVRFYQSGAIIKAVDGEVLVPEDFPVQVSLDGLLFTGKTGMCISNPYYDEASGQIQQFYVYYTRVNGPFYYIEWDDVTRVEERSRALYDLHASLEGMEKAFGTKLLIFPTQAYGSGEHYLFYRSAGLPQLETVEAFGIRTTKLEGRGGNIKILANRDVRNVINMTRKNSWYVLEVRVGTEHPLAQIEEMLAQQLPQIGSSIPEIISGPYYKGVVYIGNQTVTLSIIAECNEADYHSVQRSLNRAVQQLFENREIPLL